MLTLNAEMFENLTGTITTNLGVLLPVGLTIMGIMVCISLIPRIIYKFLQNLAFLLLRPRILRGSNAKSFSKEFYQGGIKETC